MSTSKRRMTETARAASVRRKSEKIYRDVFDQTKLEACGKQRALQKMKWKQSEG